MPGQTVFWSGAHQDSLCVAIQCLVVSLVEVTCPAVILATEKSNTLRYFCVKKTLFWFIGPA